MTRYVPAVDPSAVSAIDVHVHVQVDSAGRRAVPTRIIEAMGRYFGDSAPPIDVDETAARYRDAGMAAVVFTVDATTNLDHAPNSIDDIVEGAARNNDVLVPFGSVDPLQGEAAIEEAVRQADELGVRGFKFHPTVQAFDPSDPAYAPLFSVIEERGLPILSHTGQTGVGAGMPGGGGFRLGLSNPILLDEVAARHPDLTIIMAHPSVPWQDEALSVATHKPGAYIDLSGWSPKYFGDGLKRALRSYLNHKMLFGSDFPALTPERWLRDFELLEVEGAKLEAILKDNTAKLLGLGAA
ncbi:4-hydroxyphenyl-beta-ketoacyl-CoA hydrolase [Pseudoclavibacter endophyticus]|uniref:Amidohydrolase n=1 Tax=Pseudoclavibacter endophyticus TaxID=1778590 RepID=A0A6H9WNT7_9MICO|nr:amidohydrolase family protein [Pseudoclavibacter endophyticus]KAB1646915.1 amidohydrolase [Pseudoclavibacter endophyticus]GGA74467.1 4-hydroxyphenyl-beta-ketoacyl-CoA hydrolase [Pseudoclavibacter endophyticus]